MRYLPILLVLSGCILDPDKVKPESTDGLEPDLGIVSSFLVPGACPVTADLSHIEVAVLLAGERTLLPDDQPERFLKPLGEVITKEDFRFLHLEDGLERLPGQVEGGVRTRLDVESVEFRWNGGAARRGDDRLVLLLLDSSGSLRGRDLRTGDVYDERASDKDDQRFAFLSQLLGAIPRDHYLSLVSFNNEIPNIDPGENNDGPAVPTRNRDIIEQGLSDIEQGEEGATPLARALRDAKASIIDANADLNPVVILLTDGVGEGDPTDDADRSQLKAHIEAYAAAQIPVIVLQLQPPAAAGTPRGRDPLLVELACRTGGLYLFLEEPEELTASASRVPSVVHNALQGHWSLRVRTDLADITPRSGSHSVSSVLRLELGPETTFERLAENPDPEFDYLDTRLWLTRP